MAVEIKEIVIKAVLNQGEQSSAPGEHAQIDQEAVIQACVAQVLKVLHKKNRR